MNKVYQKELKQLTAQLTKGQRQYEKDFDTVDKNRLSEIRRTDAQIRKIRKIADRDIARLKAALKKHERACTRSMNTLTKSLSKRETALQRRIDILHGRLGS